MDRREGKVLMGAHLEDLIRFWDNGQVGTLLKNQTGDDENTPGDVKQLWGGETASSL